MCSRKGDGGGGGVRQVINIIINLAAWPSGRGLIPFGVLKIVIKVKLHVDHVANDF